MIEADYPGLWKMWEDKIVSWQDENGLPADWVVSGRWRIKDGVHGKEGRNN